MVWIVAKPFLIQRVFKYEIESPYNFRKGNKFKRTFEFPLSRFNHLLFKFQRKWLIQISKYFYSIISVWDWPNIFVTFSLIQCGKIVYIFPSSIVSLCSLFKIRSCHIKWKIMMSFYIVSGDGIRTRDRINKWSYANLTKIS